jgi:threonine dehydrogenase-like Zn-dependent dehydrogenase
MNYCLISIDGTDYHIPQMGPEIADNPFSLHKFKGKCALCHELGVDIIKGNLVWIEGPYPAGKKYSDITIFQNCLLHHLNPFETSKRMMAMLENLLQR